MAVSLLTSIIVIRRHLSCHRHRHHHRHRHRRCLLLMLVLVVIVLYCNIIHHNNKRAECTYGTYGNKKIELVPSF